MKRIICNPNTINLAKKEMWLAFRETYLLLQKYLLNCLSWAGSNEEKRKEIKKKIFEVGQIYKETFPNHKN